MSRVVATPSRRAIVAIVAFIVAFCQSGAFSALTPSDSIRGGRMIAMSRAERLVDDAVDYLEELPSLSAELNFETRLFGKRYYGHLTSCAIASVAHGGATIRLRKARR